MAADRERGHGTASAEIGKYLDILAKDPNSRVFAPLAEAYRKAGFVDDAIATALEGLKVHPNYLGGRVALGRAYFEKRQFPEAAAEMRRVVASAPDNLMAHRVLGQIARAQNDLPAAEKAFRMVLLLDPGDQEARQFVADVVGATPAMPTPAGMTRPVAPGEGEAEHQPRAVPVPPHPSGDESEAPASPTFEVPPLAEAPTTTSFETPGPRPEALAEALSPPPSPEPAEEIAIDLSEEFAVESPLESLAGAAPPPREAAPGPGTDAGLELEVFTRAAWGEEQAPMAVVSHPAEAAGATEGPPAGAAGRSPADEERWEAFREISLEPEDQVSEPAGPQPAEESPFEVFTRAPAVRVVPAPSRPNRGEGAGARDFEIETTAFLPPDEFGEVAVPPELQGLEEEPRSVDLKRETEFDFRQEAEPPSEPAPESTPEPAPELGLEPEQEAPSPALPLVAPAPGFEPELSAGPLSALESEAKPETPFEPVESLPQDESAAAVETVRELESEMFSGLESEPGLDASRPPAAPAPDEAWAEALSGSAGEAELDLGFGHELEFIPELEIAPGSGPARGVGPQAPVEPDSAGAARAPHVPTPAPPEPPPPSTLSGQEYEELTEEEAPAAAPAGLGLFDTETLATIYVKQGFYGRAAEIYQRLLAQRPGDENLRRRLAEALDLAQGTAEPRAPSATPAMPAPTGGASPVSAEVKVDRLQRLLEAFLEGRPS